MPKPTAVRWNIGQPEVDFSWPYALDMPQLSPQIRHNYLP